MKFYIFDNADNVSAKNFDDGKAAIKWFTDHWKSFVVSVLSNKSIILCDQDKNYLAQVHSVTGKVSYWSLHEWIYVYHEMGDNDLYPMLEDTLNYFIITANDIHYGLSTCKLEEALFFAIKFGFLFNKEYNDYFRLYNYNGSLLLYIYGDNNYVIS